MDGSGRPMTVAQTHRSSSVQFRVKLWGTRGTLPVSGPEHQRYGGNTICIEVRCGEHVLIFDAGSGLLPAGLALRDDGTSSVDMLFSHSHYDHIIGFPYFKPVFDSNFSMTVWSGHAQREGATHRMLHDFMTPPWFPAPLDICCARIQTRDFMPGDELELHPGLKIGTGMLNHPGNATGYRVSWQGKILAIITDTEHVPGTLDSTVLRLIEDADLVLYDACYCDEEMARFQGFGHSSWQQAIRLAKAANAKSVGFIHHSPMRDDASLDIIDQAAKEQFATAFVAHDGQVVDL